MAAKGEWRRVPAVGAASSAATADWAEARVPRQNRLRCYRFRKKTASCSAQSTCGLCRALQRRSKRRSSSRTEKLQTRSRLEFESRRRVCLAAYHLCRCFRPNRRANLCRCRRCLSGFSAAGSARNPILGPRGETAGGTAAPSCSGLRTRPISGTFRMTQQSPTRRRGVMSCQESRGAIRPAERATGARPASVALAQTTSLFLKLYARSGGEKWAGRETCGNKGLSQFGASPEGLCRSGARRFASSCGIAQKGFRWESG